MTVSAGCSVQFDSACSDRSCALEYLLEEVTITREGRLQRRDLLDGHPAGITDLSPVRPEIVVLRVRQPPVQGVGPPAEPLSQTFRTGRIVTPTSSFTSRI